MNEDSVAAGTARATGLLTWWRQGCRSAFFLRPDWRGLRATPWVVAALLLAQALLALLAERLYIDGPAQFYWAGLLGGWLGTVVLAWCCWWLGGDRPRRGADLFALLLAQGLLLLLLSQLLLVPIVRLGWQGRLGTWGYWLLWWGLLAWSLAAQLRLLARGGLTLRLGLAGLLLVGVTLAQTWGRPTQHWYAVESETAAPTRLRLTQDLLERQAGLLDERLRALQPGQAGRVELFALSFAPYGSEDVFMRESALVDEVMRTRFGAQGRSLQLVNNVATAEAWPWATPQNLRRAIQRVAALMNREEDLLFIHLSSHGARDGQLAAALWPLEVEAVTPQQLRQWLDEAGVRHRILSISACYSGSWIEPLADTGSLVMTAADAEHTSYGCGRGSELTFFGRALYAEQLRTTRSFESAHAEARRVIERREQEAGKSDGYSNPQIRVGERARRQLALLEASLGK
ncbi:C13 family peptidase [Roseateles sp. DAIF2]|uniref:C13 family peptidase n=1 Tax=Roseateles sp. DAIF2 TaxID=2714952 RepID=UPI00201D70D9|nr:C13 family peptidase [Roseateles sp. DAIF2]